MIEELYETIVKLINQIEELPEWNERVKCYYSIKRICEQKLEEEIITLKKFGKE